ncbi:MAG: hypothetical protein Q7R49_06210 [Candidatus Daviesbacteria bacterium]|nr:hypothetical protein [Candidatus Daviesbacteria bacterium]
MPNIQEAVIFQRRNRLKKHFVNVSNVLLYCYQTVSDAAKITFQIVDGFDWESKETGESKGYVFPAVETIARIRNTSVRTIQRHILELINAKLLTRVRRKYKPSILYIEEVSETEIAKYFTYFEAKKEEKVQKETIITFRNDKNVVCPKASETTKMSFVYKKENELEENETNVNEDLKTFKDSKKPNREGGIKSLRDLLIQYDLQIPRRVKNEVIRQRKTGKINGEIDKNQRDYLASEMADKLNDQKSLGCFRVIAAKVPQQVIFEVISSIKETANEGKIKVSKGALFVDVIKGYCFSHGIELGFNIQKPFLGVVEAQESVFKTS